jgi:hypothetical protein
VTPEAKKAKAEFDTMVKGAVSGDQIKYHTGDHAGGPYRHAAYAAYERGEVLLAQRRLGPMRFEYLAIRTKKK